MAPAAPISTGTGTIRLWGHLTLKTELATKLREIAMTSSGLVSFDIVSPVARQPAFSPFRYFSSQYGRIGFGMTCATGNINRLSWIVKGEISSFAGTSRIWMDHTRRGLL